jgi:tRNA(Ile)-lysidine synthase
MARTGQPPTDARALLQQAARQCVPQGARVLLAVSGGSDSMALLALAAPTFGDRAAVVHVTHGLRPSAGREAAFVAATCRALGLACEVVDAAPTLDEPGRGEAGARRRRLGALAGAARRQGAACVLLAHHLDDELETLLLRRWRGHFGARALAGMPALRPLAPGVALLRPFLLGTPPPGRAELASLRRAAGLEHVEDESNADRSVPRNAARALLADAGAPARSALLALRANARARLARLLERELERIERHLHAEGLGSRLDAEALLAPPGEDGVELRAELLRLLGAALAQPRRIDPRASVLEELEQRLRRDGPLRLPASPAALSAVVRAGALHLPHDPPAPLPSAARVLAALLRCPPPGA